MSHLPRHLLLAAVVMTVCCAERQAAGHAPEKRQVAEVSGEVRTVQVRREARRQVRPAATTPPVAVVFRRPRSIVAGSAEFPRDILDAVQMRTPPPAE